MTARTLGYCCHFFLFFSVFFFLGGGWGGGVPFFGVFCDKCRGKVGMVWPWCVIVC